MATDRRQTAHRRVYDPVVHTNETMENSLYGTRIRTPAWKSLEDHSPV